MSLQMIDHKNAEFWAVIRSGLEPEARTLEAAHDPDLISLMEHISGISSGAQDVDVVVALERVRSNLGLDAESFEETANICHTLVQERQLNG